MDDEYERQQVLRAIRRQEAYNQRPVGLITHLASFVMLIVLIIAGGTWWLVSELASVLAPTSTVTSIPAPRLQTRGSSCSYFAAGGFIRDDGIIGNDGRCYQSTGRSAKSPNALSH